MLVTVGDFFPYEPKYGYVLQCKYSRVRPLKIRRGQKAMVRENFHLSLMAIRCHGISKILNLSTSSIPEIQIVKQEHLFMSYSLDT